MVDTAYGVFGARMGICTSNLLVFHFLGFALHSRQLSIGLRLIDGCWYDVTLFVYLVGPIALITSLYLHLLRLDSWSKAATSSRRGAGERPPGRVFGLCEPQIHNVRVWEAGAVEA